MAMGNQAKDVENSQPASSWGRFARRMQSNSHFHQDTNNSKDALWLYVAISVLYFFLIGLVLLILLLAPKFKPTLPSPVSEVSVHSENSIIVSEAGTETLPGMPVPAASDDYLEDDSKEAFSAPIKDPLYDFDIDPRSPIFRGDMHKWQNYPEGRSRANDKFLQD